MTQDTESLKSLHSNLNESVVRFANAVLATADGRSAITDVKDMSIRYVEGVKKLIITRDGWCFVYDGDAGVCRECTAEERG